MPAHPIHDPPALDLPSQQQSVCAKCLSTLDTTGSVSLPGAGTFVCIACREFLLRDFEPRLDQSLRLHTRDDAMLLADVTNHSFRVHPDLSSKSLRKPAISCITANLSPLTSPPAIHPSNSAPIDSRRHKCTALDPLVDITRLRVRTSSHHCLYPGATFVGTQKSGRSSYDVTVTVVDVDFSSSFLCGYLRIRGLTDDWPELTTYFDAEIIGSRYGFLTQNWGASEQDDMVHWARFPAFKHVKHELKEPLLTMADRDRGAVFMRWKERFLVPDHRVQDISGASFAGFYYVCVDFTPPPDQPSTSGPVDADAPPSSPQRNRRNASRRRGCSPCTGPFSIPVATMNGFYYHQNSEPYQQLSLTHVPERTSSGFEFR